MPADRKDTLPINVPVIVVERHARHVALGIFERQVHKSADNVTGDIVRVDVAGARFVATEILRICREIEKTEAVACPLPRRTP
jgi:hypothetical protein